MIYCLFAGNVLRHVKLLTITGGMFLSMIPNLATALEEYEKDWEKLPRDEVAAGLKSNIYNRIRLGFYEESLATTIKVWLELKDGMNESDSALVDLVLAKCLLTNRTNYQDVVYLLENGITNDRAMGMHTEKEQFALRIGLAEGYLETGAKEKARAMLEPMADKMSASLQKEIDGLLKKFQEQQKIDLLDRDHDFLHALIDRIHQWASVGVLLNRAMPDGEFFAKSGNSGSLRKMLTKGVHASWYQNAIEVDQHGLEPYFTPLLQLTVDLVHVKAGESQKEAVSLAKLALSILNKEGDWYFRTQRAALLSAIVAVADATSRIEKDQLIELLTQTPYYRDHRLYEVAVAGAYASGDPDYVAKVITAGQLRLQRHLAAVQNHLRDNDPAEFKKLERAYGKWIDSRAVLGVMHPSTILWWDEVYGIMFEASEQVKPGTVSEPAFKLGSVGIAYLQVHSHPSLVNREGPSRYVALVFLPDGSHEMYPLAETGKVNALVDRYRNAINADVAVEIKGMSRELYKILITPVEKGSKAVRGSNDWIISLDGPVSMLPFFALLNPGDEALGTVRNLTHVNYLPGWRGQEATLPKGGIDALLVGDPMYDDDDGITLIKGKNRAALFTMAKEGYVWNRIPGTGEEVELLERVCDYHGWGTQILQRQKATEKNVRQAMRGNRIIHLATHGMYYPDHPSRSTFSGSPGLFHAAVVFNGVNAAIKARRKGIICDSENDGVLMAAEVAQMDLRDVFLVSLSACETAEGEPEPGEGVSGFSSGLAIAGSQQTLLTLWPINDAYTPKVMGSFFGRLSSDTSAQEALRFAMRRHFMEVSADGDHLSAVRLALPFRLETNTLLGGGATNVAVPDNGGTPKPPTSATVGIGTVWVIACEAPTSKEAAMAAAKKWKSKGLDADALWIPDYKSLSGAQRWLTYVGPWSMDTPKDEIRAVLRNKVLPFKSDAYVIRVDQNGKRETFK